MTSMSNCITTEVFKFLNVGTQATSPGAQHFKVVILLQYINPYAAVMANLANTK